MKIKEVKSKKDYKEFLSLPKLIYSDNPHFVMPLNLHLNMMIGKIGSPKKHLFLAYEDDKLVARLGVKVHHQHGEGDLLHWGFFECKKNNEVATKALFDHAHSMYPELNMRGPYHFRMEDPYIGTLVEGFDEDPFFLMSYNPEYYDEYLKNAGNKVAMDLVTYNADSRRKFEPEFYEKAEDARKKGITIRWLDPKNMKKEVEVVARIFNDALSNNWGFEEMIESQIKEMYLMFKLFLDPRIIAFAQRDGKDVGCLILLPNYNPILKGNSGRLTPSLIWKFMRNKKKVDTARGYALGVLKGNHGYGIGTALMDAAFKKAAECGIHHGEISWILSNNDSMNALVIQSGGKPNKKYRIYDKDPL